MTGCQDSDGAHTGASIVAANKEDPACGDAMVAQLKSHSYLVSWASNLDNYTAAESTTIASNCFFECSGLIIACCQYGFTDDQGACKS